MSLITIDWKPNLRTLRQFGWLMAAACLLAAAVVAWKNWTPGSAVPASSLVLSGLSVLAFLIAAVRPSWLRPVYLGWMGAAFPIGWVLSHVLLGILYFVVFSIVGLILRMVGWDSLHRNKPAGVDTYWVTRKRERAAEDYFRQF